MRNFPPLVVLSGVPDIICQVPKDVPSAPPARAWTVRQVARGRRLAAVRLAYQTLRTGPATSIGASNSRSNVKK